MKYQAGTDSLMTESTSRQIRKDDLRRSLAMVIQDTHLVYRDNCRQYPIREIWMRQMRKYDEAAKNRQCGFLYQQSARGVRYDALWRWEQSYLRDRDSSLRSQEPLIVKAACTDS